MELGHLAAAPTRDSTPTPGPRDFSIEDFKTTSVYGGRPHAIDATHQSPRVLGFSAGGGTAVLVHTYGGARANQAKRTSDVEFGARDALKER